MNANTSLFVLLLAAAMLMASHIARSADYYWVGGSGNWSDLTHWATTSGGSLHPSVVPGAADDVFFDANSFTSSGQTVTVNTPALCRNISWVGATNNPTFAGTSQLNVHGSYTLIPAMTHTRSGATYFKSTGAGNTITSAGKSFNGNIFIDAPGGEYALQDNFTVSGDIRVDYGTFRSMDKTIIATALRSETANTHAIYLGSSQVSLSASVFGSFAVSFTGAGLTFDAGTSTITLTNENTKLHTDLGGLSFHNIIFSNTGGSGTIDAYGGTTFNNVFFLGNGTITKNNASATACTYNEVAFAKNATIDYNNNFESLIFQGNSSTITLGSGATQTVNSYLEFGSGSCALPATIKSTSTTVQASISKATGSYTLDYYKFNDINFTGGAIWTGPNALEDDGNNSGISITLATTSAITYYWVGGTGNWNDPTHWATSSGGPGQSADGCLPDANDDVFFDANSFTAAGQTVTVNVAAQCRNISWVGATNNPTFAGASQLDVHGSYTLIPAMNHTRAGATYFKGTSAGNTITSAGKSFNASVRIDAAGGEYILQDPLDIAGAGRNLFVDSGTFRTNGHNVSASSLRSEGSNARAIYLGNSQVTLSATGGTTALLFNDSNLTFEKGTSTITFTGVNPNLSASLAGGAHFHNIVFSHATGTGRLNAANGSSFNQVTFAKHATINNNNTFESLIFQGNASTITLGSGATQTVNSYLEFGSGSCALPATIKSSSTTVQATINKTAGSYTLDYYKFNDINFTGGATWTGPNALEDDGNNTGISITLATASEQTYYWVGGTGNWSDPTHWATTSGGPGQSADGCLPDANDDVFFDVNSFTATGQTVTVNIAAQCRNISWTGVTNNPTFAGGSQMDVHGSYTLISAMNHTRTGSTHFKGTGAGNTITSAGKSFGSVNFNAPGGEYTLQDDFSSSTLTITAGTFRTDDHDLSAYSLTSTTSVSRAIFLGSSQLTLTGGSWTLYFSGSNLTFDKGTSTITFTDPGPTLYSNLAGMCFYDIVFSNASGTGTIEAYGGNEFNDVSFLGNGIITKVNTPVTARSFNQVTFAKNATINYNNTFDSLIFQDSGASATYTFESGYTQTVNDHLEISGSGCFPATLRSSAAGSAATISYSAPKILDADFLIIRDIAASGGATFNAGGNSEDEGGNSGWTWGGPTWTTSLGVYYECKAEMWPYILRPVNDEFARSYTWSTGETADHITVTAFGTYWCTSYYGLNCIQTDTFHVGASSYAGAVTTYFAQIVDTLWQKCQNWTNMEIPDATTSVIVDTGKRLYIGDNVTAVCKDITINPGGSLHIGGGKLFVHGDFINNGSFSHTADSVIFTGTEQGAVSGTDNITFYKLYLDKTDASDIVEFAAPVSIAHSMSFTRGIAAVEETAYILFLEGGEAVGSNAASFVDGRVRKTGSSDFVFPLGNQQKWARLGISDLVSASTFEARYHKGGYPETTSVDPLHHPSFVEYWLLERISGASGAKATLYWEDSGFSAIQSADPSDLCVAHFNGAGWEDYGHDDAAQTGSTGWIRSAYHTSFSPLTFGALSTSNPLPVDLVDFRAMVTQQREVELRWTTSAELNNDYFSVERSKNGRDFETIRTVKGNGTSNRTHHYTITDGLPHPGLSYYRLRQTDFDGSYKHSNIIPVELLPESMPMNIYPNPAAGDLNFEGWFDRETRVSCRLYNSLGITLKRSEDMHHGRCHFSFDVSGYPSGIYFVEIGIDGRIFTDKVVIQGR